MRLKQVIAGAAIVVLSVLCISTVVGQEGQQRMASANGEGTLKVGQERFKLHGVTVKLLDDRKAELILNSDITVFLSGTWSPNSESEGAFDLQISGGASPSGLEAIGKVTLGKSPSDLRLILKGKSITKKTVEVYFVGK